MEEAILPLRTSEEAEETDDGYVDVLIILRPKEHVLKPCIL